MKKTIFMVMMMFLLVPMGYTQEIRIAPLIEKTVAGIQYGAQLNFMTKSKWSVGAFYQESRHQIADGSQQTNSLAGLSVSAPLAKSEKMNFYFNTRLGVVDQGFIVIAPGLETEIKILKAISISALMSIRMASPSAVLKVSVKI